MQDKCGVVETKKGCGICKVSRLNLNTDIQLVFTVSHDRNLSVQISPFSE
jgi:hypothetical protein